MCRYVTTVRYMRRPDGDVVCQCRPVYRDFYDCHTGERAKPQIGPWDIRFHLRHRYDPKYVFDGDPEYGYLPRPRGERKRESRYWQWRAHTKSLKYHRINMGFLMTIRHPHWGGTRSSDPIPFPPRFPDV